jgi:hypothetical protein
MTEVRDASVVLKELCVDIPTLKLDVKTEETASFSARLIEFKRLNIQQNRVFNERSKLRLSIDLLSRRELELDDMASNLYWGSIAQESRKSSHSTTSAEICADRPGLSAKLA